jgi:hypothetical protein
VEKGNEERREGEREEGRKEPSEVCHLLVSLGCHCGAVQSKYIFVPIARLSFPAFSGSVSD